MSERNLRPPPTPSLKKVNDKEIKTEDNNNSDDKSKTGEKMASAQVTEIFNCTPEEFFKLMSDYEKYPEFLDELKAVKILKTDGNSKEMEYTASVIKTFKYKLKVEEKPPSSIAFKYTEGDVFKAMNGSWKIEPEGSGKSKVTYSVEASFGLLVPNAIAKTLVSVNLPAMMSSIKKRITKVYGK